MDACKDCLHVRELERRVVKIEEEVESIKSTVSEIKVDQATSKEQMKIVFKILTEIKDSVKDISNQLNDIKSKPADTLDKIKLSVATAIIGAIIGIAAGRIF